MLLDEFDLDGRGRLNFFEFTKMMSQESMKSELGRGIKEMGQLGAAK